MDDITLSTTYWWLIIGIICIGAEAFGISGIGFFFAGLAAFIVSLFIHLTIIEEPNIILQTGIFFAFTFVFAVILWKPLKNWRTTSSSGQDFENIVGDAATVADGGLHPGKQGKVRWSGTTMFAILSIESDVSSMSKGEMVEIVAVKGNVLIVKPMGE